MIQKHLDNWITVGLTSQRGKWAVFSLPIYCRLSCGVMRNWILDLLSNGTAIPSADLYLPPEIAFVGISNSVSMAGRIKGDERKPYKYKLCWKTDRFNLFLRFDMDKIRPSVNDFSSSYHLFSFPTEHGNPSYRALRESLLMKMLELDYEFVGQCLE